VRTLRWIPAAIAAAALAAAGGAASASAMAPMGDMSAASGPTVSILFGAYAPPQTEALVGDTVTWTNTSVRNHTVSADDGSWSSERLFNGDAYAHAFSASGTFAYYCKVHAFMHGEVDVHRVLLDPQPVPAAPRRPFPLHGRAALPEGGTVSIEADSGAGFAPLTSASAGSDGSFTATVTPQTTTAYRAVVGGEASPPVMLLVLDRTVTVRSTRARGGRFAVSARVAPASPGATVVLQLRLRDRFGWWPVQVTRLDKASAARFSLRLRQRVPARVLLTLRDGATALASSRTLHLGGR
jgi:plastocyanin